MIEALDTTITGVHTAPLELDEPFDEFCARFADRPGTVVLLSGGDLDCARHHILAARPWLELRCRGREAALTTADGTRRWEQDPIAALDELLEAFRLPDGMDLPGPVAAGLFGYLAYDLKDALETLPRTSVDDLKLPQLCLFAPSLLVVHERRSGRTNLCVPRRRTAVGDTLEADLAAFEKIRRDPIPSRTGFGGDPDRLRSNFTPPAYMAAVARIRDYIRSGDVYQVNLSQRFETEFSGRPYDLFRDLYDRNPAPFFAFVQAGDHQIVSTSPERFILREGSRVETRPIKGTRPRGTTAEEDRALRRELAASPKDEAELSMIVDLLRNDIGKVCRGGSVRVTEHKRLEAYRNVYHLVSVVTGELEPDCGSADLIAAAFPGGSITGCPKIRAMEIIDELETCRRHVYCGSIGYVSFHDTLDLSIAIRTATVSGRRIVFSVGGGVVWDSDPADEYEETLHKAQTLMGAFSGRSDKPERGPQVWFNGGIIPAQAAAVPLSDLGVQYGYGFFETVRCDRGRPARLPAHRRRFERAWRVLFGGPPPDLSWGTIINQVLDANDLADRTAAVKILATRGANEEAPFDHTLAVTARPYTHRLKARGAAGLRLAVYPHPRQSPLAAHKTCNYLYYLLAGRWARENAADEALILNPGGTISETHSANLLRVRGQRVAVPASPHVLPGVMQQAVSALLTEYGYEVEECTLVPADLEAGDMLLATNSLMGAVPVLSVDGRPLTPAEDLCRRLNHTLLGTPQSG